MKKNVLSFVLVTIILFVSFTCFISRTALANVPSTLPKESVDENNTNNSTTNSPILINYFNSNNQLPNGCYIATNYAELNRLEDRFLLDLSRSFERTDEFHNDDFVYFIQIYTPQHDSDIKDQYPINFNIDNFKAYFDYGKTDSTHLTVLYPSRIAIAAVPKNLLLTQDDINDNLYVNKKGTTWNRLEVVK